MYIKVEEVTVEPGSENKGREDSQESKIIVMRQLQKDSEFKGSVHRAFKEQFYRWFCGQIYSVGKEWQNNLRPFGVGICDGYSVYSIKKAKKQNNAGLAHDMQLLTEGYDLHIFACL